MTVLKLESGWLGLFTRNEAPGCYANGTRIMKVAMDRGDSRDLGETGTVLGSMHHKDHGNCYFIEWDSHRGVAIAVIDWKIAKADRVH